MTVYLKRYTHGTSTYVDTITDTITFTASGTTESIDYHQPIDSTYDYEADKPATTIAAV